MTNPSNFQNSSALTDCQIALETIGKGGSIAILSGRKVIWKRQIGAERRAAADLAIGLDDALRYARDQQIRLDFLSVAIGPGSFTGLRIAVTTVKTLAYALDLPIIPIGSLAGIAIAALAKSDSDHVLVGLNAYRGQVFTAKFSRTEIFPARISAEIPEQSDSDNSDWATRAVLIDRPQWDLHVTESGGSECLVVCEPSIASQQVDLVLDQDAAINVAAGIGLAAYRRRGGTTADSGHRSDHGPYRSAFALAPSYIKLSAAEEKASER
ncbi:tRNA (adenosine(37)-N6)-threonylcarbamoyltransferase complex dimerization subunit type 1 TsaB [Stieleria sp. JC731]|uniref:tRNA (adenosine(37)-N6)-threonylcarbamoyltransferase complex dimerization subunit type 1 TsaB n=1 Tax=Pirellulaceae TaxID=2691357 RepID=UPI001E3BF3F9|nr:tRNA (adenosine(37)-N6)-threonylcarbamoyltransferase complex dimerization subunit type 1 TsaB [Stieleria sp. JC731]MCC9599264.1 tRNA (adenosine(37)-N6)-threonylcarbamoyltransferase complex dimerization subunit type 1 TsaB [Stieleria sp. JC731]